MLGPRPPSSSNAAARFVRIDRSGKQPAASSEDYHLWVDRRTGLGWLPPAFSGLESPAALPIAERLIQQLAPLRGLEFRVPTIDEYGTLIDRARCAPAVCDLLREANPVLISQALYASRSPHCQIAGRIWCADFADGSIAHHDTVGTFQVLPVCGPISDLVVREALPATPELQVWAKGALFR